MPIQKVQKLFQFLKEFNKLKIIKPQVNVNSFEKVLWFHEIPKEKECYSILHDDDFEKTKFHKWIEIKKPKITSCPKAPKEIRPWLKVQSHFL